MRISCADVFPSMHVGDGGLLMYGLTRGFLGALSFDQSQEIGALLDLYV